MALIATNAAGLLLPLKTAVVAPKEAALATNTDPVTASLYTVPAVIAGLMVDTVPVIVVTEVTFATIVNVLDPVTVAVNDVLLMLVGAVATPEI